MTTGNITTGDLRQNGLSHPGALKEPSFDRREKTSVTRTQVLKYVSAGADVSASMCR